MPCKPFLCVQYLVCTTKYQHIAICVVPFQDSVCHLFRMRLANASRYCSPGLNMAGSMRDSRMFNLIINVHILSYLSLYLLRHIYPYLLATLKGTASQEFFWIFKEVCFSVIVYMIKTSYFLVTPSL